MSLIIKLLKLALAIGFAGSVLAVVLFFFLSKGGDTYQARMGFYAFVVAVGFILVYWIVEGLTEEKENYFPPDDNEE